MANDARKAIQDAIQADFDSMNAATSASQGLAFMQYGRDDADQHSDALLSAADAMATTTNATSEASDQLATDDFE